MYCMNFSFYIPFKSRLLVLPIVYLINSYKRKFEFMVRAGFPGQSKSKKKYLHKEVTLIHQLSSLFLKSNINSIIRGISWNTSGSNKTIKKLSKQFILKIKRIQKWKSFTIQWRSETTRYWNLFFSY